MLLIIVILLLGVVFCLFSVKIHFLSLLCCTLYLMFDIIKNVNVNTLIILAWLERILVFMNFIVSQYWAETNLCLILILPLCGFFFGNVFGRLGVRYITVICMVSSFSLALYYLFFIISNSNFYTEIGLINWNDVNDIIKAKRLFSSNCNTSGVNSYYWYFNTSSCGFN